MAITAIKVTIDVKPISLACKTKGGVFTVTAKIRGIADANGGSYDVYIKSKTGIFKNPVLVEDKANKVLGGKIKDDQTYELFCDKKCHIAGKDGTSGANPADIYALVDAGNGIEAESGPKTLTCTEEEEKSPPRKGSDRVQPRKSA